jgi:riboflavin kinase / FMN adenylyltransferase
MRKDVVFPGYAADAAASARRQTDSCHVDLRRYISYRKVDAPTMQLLRGFTDTDRYRGGFVAIGNFDGVHRGHQRMIGTLVAQARDAGLPAVVMTFDPHPIALLTPGRVPPTLSTLERKAELIGACGVDVLIAYPTDQTLLNLTPEEFFEQIIRDRLQAQGLVEGPNFGFGKDRTGDVDTLQSLCDRDGLVLTIVDAVACDNEPVVSSSAIRRTIAAGDLSRAVAMLGHPYRLTGVVESGAKRGTGLGFPTANIAGVQTLLPPDGVYAGCCVIAGETYAAAVHLGPNPTFADQTRKLEVHVLDFAGDLYGQRLSVDLIDRVRDTMRFESTQSLQQQLQRDIETVRSRCGLYDS